MRTWPYVLANTLLITTGTFPSAEGRNWLTFWRSERPNSKPTVDPNPEIPSEKTEPSPTPQSPTQPINQATLPAFMAPLQDPHPNDPWADYTDHSSAFAPSLTLQGFLYVDEENWNVWLNDCLLTPELRSLKVGPFLAEVTSITSRTVTFRCTGPEEMSITLSAGQVFNLQEHTLRRQ